MSMDTLSNAYWLTEFDISTDDLARITDRMREEIHAFTLDEMVRRLVRGRLRHGRDASPAAVPAWVQEQKILSWDQLAEWKTGDQVLVVSGIKGKTQPFFGRILREDANTFYIRLQGIQEPIKYGRVAPGSQEAQQRYAYVKNAIWEREQAARQKALAKDDEENIEVIVLTFGSHIATRLLTALEHDPRFYTYEDRWLLTEKMEALSPHQLEALHRRLFAYGKALLLPDLLPWSKLAPGDVGLFSLHRALIQTPDKFASTDKGWLALKPVPPPWPQAMSAFYVYDPGTYEIILQPRQRLKEAVAQRLETLGWYADLVVPA